MQIKSLFALGIALLLVGAAHAQTYAPLAKAPGIVVTGIRQNSSTDTDVVVTSSYVSFSGAYCPSYQLGGDYAALYSGSITDVSTSTVKDDWHCLAPNFPGQTVISATFYGPNTYYFDPSIGMGNVLAVGSYKNSASDSAHGMIYQGPPTGCPGGSSSCWTQIDATCLVPPGETLMDTIAHSTQGTLVVGNWDTDKVVGRAFVYDMSSNSDCRFTELKPDIAEISATAYGIWANSDGSYTIAGGKSDTDNGGVDDAWLADYDPTHMLLYHVTYYHFDKGSLVTHFDGITPYTTGNGYDLTGDYVKADGTEDGFFASVPRNSDGTFGDAVWTDIGFSGSGVTFVKFTSGNTVYSNSAGSYVLGIFDGIVPGNKVFQWPGVFTTLSYVATLSTQ